MFLIGAYPVTLNGSSSSAVFNFTSNVSVSLDVSLRVRTRLLSSALIEIRQDFNAFFEMQLTSGQVNVRYLLERETGFILSGKSCHS